MNEEIKKLIEEEARNRYLEYLHGTSNEKEFLSMTDLLPLHDSIKACEITVNFILSKRQEAERWRKVEEELPDPDIAVLCRMKSPNVIVEGFIYKHNGIAKIETQPDFEFEDYADGEVIEWKPISSRS